MRQGISKFVNRLARVMYERTMFVLVIMFTLGVTTILWDVSRVQSKLIQSTMLHDAALYTSVLAEFRALYTSDVVARVRPHGIEVSHDYETKEKAIPLPATLSMKLGQRIGSHHSGTQSRLYSPYPFPWRGEDSGLQDTFARDAWNHLQQNPETPFYRFGEYRGRPSLRYATADRMKADCISCHNSHPDSPKTDWKLGDVRGVLEIIHPIDTVIAKTHDGFTETLVVTVFLTVLGLFALGLVFRKLRRSSKELEHRVLRRTNELIEANKELQNEIVERKRLENEQVKRFQIEQECNHLQEAVRAHEKVLAVVGHELRTPLASVRAMAELVLRSDAGSAAKHDKFIQDIRDEAVRMADTVNDLIEVARTNSGRARWNWSNFSVIDACKDALIPLYPIINETTVKFKLEVNPPGLKMNGDRNAIRRLVLNLANNACKHTSEGFIEVRANHLAKANRDWIEIQVCDTGEGMPPEIAAKLGKPFALNRGIVGDDHVQGSGLGLAICKGIVSAHGGRILVSSQQGVGTIVTVELRADLSGPTYVKVPQSLTCEVTP